MSPETSALYARAADAMQRQEFAQALELFDQVTQDAAAPVDAWLNAAQLALGFNKPKQAEAYLETVRPKLKHDYYQDGTLWDHPVMVGLLARCYRLQLRYDEAITLIEPWVPYTDYTPAMQLDHGLCLAGKQHLVAGLKLVEGAIAKTPDNVEMLCHAAAIALKMDDSARAHGWIDKALAIDPNLPQALYLKADACDAERQLEDAFAYYQRAQAYEPWPDAALSKLTILTRALIEWDAAADVDQRLIEHLEAVEADEAFPHTIPFAYVYASDDQRLARRAADQMVKGSLIDYANRKQAGQVLPALPKPGAAAATKRLRLGYMSSDFNHHAGMHLVASMFQHHDREQFEVYGLAVGDHSQNTMRELIAAQMDAMIDVADPDPLSGAQAIRDLDLDILIDLRGFTANSRIHLCLERPAHLHATWLGYAGPVAAGVVDYQIVDPVIAPPSGRDDFGAALAYLPITYQMTDNQQPRGEPIARDAVLPGVPEDCFVFASFCQTYKIQPESFTCWMEILERVPKSVLWLWADYPQAQENLRALAKAAGVKPDRLIFAARLPKAQHIPRVSHADLILDTWRYGGHVTTSDMIWAGVPVLAKTGTHFASRVAESLLNAAGLADTVMPDPAAYRDKAVALAQDPAALAAIRKRVEQARTHSHLFDTQGRVKHLEQLYRAMWQRYCAGQPPGDITLEATS